jgi:hypothetical protein
MTHTVKYIIQSQCATTGRYDDTATYDNLPYAQIHYDALNINCLNRLAKIVSTKSQDVYTEVVLVCSIMNTLLMMNCKCLNKKALINARRLIL